MGGGYTPQPRFGGGANRPTTIKMWGVGRRPLVGGAKPKKALYTLLFTFYCIFKNKFYTSIFIFYFISKKEFFQKLLKFSKMAPSAPNLGASRPKSSPPIAKLLGVRFTSMAQILGGPCPPLNPSLSPPPLAEKRKVNRGSERSCKTPGFNLCYIIYSHSLYHSFNLEEVRLCLLKFIWLGLTKLVRLG